MGNPVEVWKQQKHGFDVWPDVLAHARAGTAMKDIDTPDLERMKWYGVFYRKRDTPGSYMLRIRITANELSSAQAKEIARIAYEVGYGIVDVTTRANIQVQGLGIADVPRALERLEAVGLTTRQTGHDNVRNVFCHPLSGVDPHELIDTRSLCREISALFLGHRQRASLPRKFNIAVCGRSEHSIHYWTQDIALLAVRRANRVGFHVLVGGKQGQTPQLGQPLPLFLPPESAADLVATILDLFQAEGPREKRDASRFHFLLERIGIDGLMQVLRERMTMPCEPCDSAPAPPSGYEDLVGWFPQKQPDLWAMGLCPALGRMSWMQLEGLGVAAQRWGNGQLRTTPEQGIMILNVRTGFRDSLAAHVGRWNLSVYADSRTRSMVACTGKQFCNIAVTETKAHALQLIEQLRRRSLELHGIRIHMSGCPSACANHHTADIGLKGVRVKRLLGTREGFDVYLGGGVAGRLHTALPYRLGVDVDQLPNLIDELVREYYLRHQDGETFSEYWRKELERREPTAAGEGDYQPPVWECDVCRHQHTGDDPPIFCPNCAALRRHFARCENGSVTQSAEDPSCQSAPLLRLDAEGYAVAAQSAAIPNSGGLFVQLGPYELALFRDGDQFVALDNTCPHAGGSLAEGALSNGCVTCPLHGWKFDVRTGQGLAPTAARVAVYPIKVIGDDILVKLGGGAA